MRNCAFWSSMHLADFWWAAGQFFICLWRAISQASQKTNGYVRISVSRMVRYYFDCCSCPGRMLDQRECNARWDEISIFGRTRWNRIVFLWFQKTRTDRTSATRCIELQMGFAGFYVEMLPILLRSVWIWHVRAGADFVFFLQRIMTISFYVCTNVRGARARAQFWKGTTLHPCNCCKL